MPIELDTDIFCSPQCLSLQDCYRGEKKLDRIHLLHYIINILLPVVKQINRDQDIELEKEAKITGTVVVLIGHP